MLIIHALDAEKSTGKSKHTNNRQRGIMMLQTMSMSSPKPALKPANVGIDVVVSCALINQCHFHVEQPYLQSTPKM
jgi:hypothetical protein